MHAFGPAAIQALEDVVLGEIANAEKVKIGDLVRCARSTSGSCVSSASCLFRHGVRNLGVLHRNPVKDLERGDLPSARRMTEPRYLSLDEVRSLLEHMTPQFRPIAATCYWAGLRVSEALDLRWADVDLAEEFFMSRERSRRRVRDLVPVVDDLAEEFMTHLRRRTDRDGEAAVVNEDFVFRTPSGKSPGRRNVHRAVARAAEKARLSNDGREPVGVHDLRHSFAARALAGGLSIVETSRLLRHANAHVTGTIYAGLNDDDLAALGERLNALNRTTTVRMTSSIPLDVFRPN